MRDFEVMAKITPAVIESNFDDIKAAVSEQMAAYEGLEITEDTEKERKADLATLRKIDKAIDERRKEIEAEYKKPFEEFKAKVNEIRGEIAPHIVNINNGLKALDDKRVAKKQEHLRRLYEEHIGKYSEYLSFEDVKKPQWDNKTYGDNQILFDISERVTRVQSDLEALEALNSPIRDTLYKIYKAEGLAAALKRNTDYLEAKKQAEENQRREEDRKVETLPETKEPVPDFMPKPVEDSIVIRITGSENIDAVVNFLTMTGIDYQEV